MFKQSIIQSKRILFLNWKDILHPASGGAEVVTDALASHLAKNNEVFFITSTFAGADPKQVYNNYTILRAGSVSTSLIHAYFLYLKLSKEKKFNLIIDQVHGVPFFSIFYPGHPRILVIIHEVAGELWKSILPHGIGKIIDTVWLRLYRNNQFITVSNSTKQELTKNNIPKKNIAIIPNFTEIHLSEIPKKAEHPTLLVLGRIAPVKQIEHAIMAHRIIKKSIPNIKLVIMGKTAKQYNTYHKYIKKLIQGDNSIALLTNATEEEKLHWLKQAHILLMPSKKEGYGIAILEANACGMPAVGYNASGIRDAIIHNETGLIADKETPESLAFCAHSILSNPEKCTQMQQSAHNHAEQQNKRITISAWDNVIDNFT